MQAPLKRHQQQPSTAVPPMLTIHDLPDACLAHCLSFLLQEERFQSVALVSRRFHSLTCSPEVLRDLHICIGSRQPATRQLELVRSWLLKHTNSLRSVTIHMSSHKGDLIPLLDSCVAAATSGGMLQSLDLIQVRGGFDDSWPPYTLGRWAQSTGASSLRRLAIWHGSVLTIHCSLEGLSQLECLDLGGHALTLSSAARLPPSLTRLELAYDRSYGDVADIQSLQIGHLSKLRSLMLDGTSKLGLIDCPGALVAGLSLSSPLEHLRINNFAAGPWLPAAAQRLSALRVLQVHMWNGQDKEQPAWHASLNSALAHMPQLEALWMAGNWDQGFQTAIAGLARLERLFWRDVLGRQPTVPLPHGPYQLSMRQLVLQSDLAQLSTATLAGMPQLERLSLFEALCNRESSLWNAFWCWAERHQELRCLELMDEAWVEDGVLPTPTVNAMLQLASCRPSPLLRALPSDDEKDGFKAYRESILGKWK